MTQNDRCQWEHVDAKTDGYSSWTQTDSSGSSRARRVRTHSMDVKESSFIMSSSAKGTDEAVLVVLLIFSSRTPKQATRIRAHEQGLVQPLQRYRNNGTDRNAQRSNSGDSQGRAADRPQESTNKTDSNIGSEEAERKRRQQNQQERTHNQNSTASLKIPGPSVHQPHNTNNPTTAQSRPVNAPKHYANSYRNVIQHQTMTDRQKIHTSKTIKKTKCTIEKKRKKTKHRRHLEQLPWTQKKHHFHQKPDARKSL